MSARRILVFGVSGVGKSFASAQFAASNPHFVHLRASELLSAALKTSPELLRTAPKDEFLRNQSLLSNALERRVAHIAGMSILLDGHALIDTDRNLVPVPVGAVSALHPDGMILLEASPTTVLLRRQASERVRPERNLPELTEQLKREREVVEEYSLKLNVPLVSAWAEPIAQLDHAMAKLLEYI